MKPNLNKPQKYVLIKHILATSVEEAIKKQHSAPVVYAYVEQPEAEPARQVGF